jgi:hypothetical protein
VLEPRADNTGGAGSRKNLEAVCRARASQPRCGVDAVLRLDDNAVIHQKARDTRTTSTVSGTS